MTIRYAHWVPKIGSAVFLSLLAPLFIAVLYSICLGGSGDQGLLFAALFLGVIVILLTYEVTYQRTYRFGPGSMIRTIQRFLVFRSRTSYAGEAIAAVGVQARKTGVFVSFWVYDVVVTLSDGRKEPIRTYQEPAEADAVCDSVELLLRRNESNRAAR
ncbi:MAG: hypothetical protein AMXMBFR13_46990 [Phycisphaerae bacterium]